MHVLSDSRCETENKNKHQQRLRPTSLIKCIIIRNQRRNKAEFAFSLCRALAPDTAIPSLRCYCLSSIVMGIRRGKQFVISGRLFIQVKRNTFRTIDRELSQTVSRVSRELKQELRFFGWSLSSRAPATRHDG